MYSSSYMFGERLFQTLKASRYFHVTYEKLPMLTIAASKVCNGPIRLGRESQSFDLHTLSWRTEHIMKAPGSLYTLHARMDKNRGYERTIAGQVVERMRGPRAIPPPRAVSLSLSRSDRRQAPSKSIKRRKALSAGQDSCNEQQNKSRQHKQTNK